jgi:hypothetical protein
MDLAITFVDRAKGGPASGRIELFKDGEKLFFRQGSDGTALLLDEGREDFTLRVVMSGYEPEEVQVAYADLDEQAPQVEVELMPLDDLSAELFTFEGDMPGLTEVDAVRLGPAAWTSQGIDARKRLLTVHSLYNNEIAGRRCALVASDESAYEPIDIVKNLSKGVYKLEKAPETDISGLNVARRVTGKVQDGHYLLRLPDDVTGARWLLRAVTSDSMTFRTFEAADADRLANGGRIAIDAAPRAAPVKAKRDMNGTDAQATSSGDVEDVNIDGAAMKGG